MPGIYDAMQQLAQLRLLEYNLKRSLAELETDPVMQQAAAIKNGLAGVRSEIATATDNARQEAIRYAQETGERKAPGFKVNNTKKYLYETPEAVAWSAQYSPISLQPDLNALEEAPLESKVKLVKWMAENCPELLTVDNTFVKAAEAAGADVLKVETELKALIDSDLSVYLPEEINEDSRIPSA